MWHSNVTENKDFDETFSYLVDNVGWFAPVAQPIAQWKNMAYIFSFSLWITILFSIIIFTSIWIILEYKVHQSNPIQMIFIILGLAFNNPQPNRKVLRSMLALFLLYVLVITSSFQSNLISILTRPIYEEQIRNIIDATNKTNYKYGYHVALHALIKSEQTTISEKILKNEIYCELNALECMNRTALKREMLLAKGGRFMTFMISKFYTNRDGKSLLYTFQDKVFTYPITMLMIKGHPLYDEFNRVLLCLQNGGFIEKLSKDYERLSMKRSDDNDSSDIEEDNLVITLNHVLIPFFILFIGLILSLFVFIFERMCYVSYRK